MKISKAILFLTLSIFLLTFVSADSFGYDSTETIITGDIFQNITNINQTTVNSGNSTFNQTLTDLLYCPKIFGYNMSTTAINYLNTTYGRFWYNMTIGGSSVAGSNKQVQFNDGGSLGANTNFTFNKTINSLAIGTPNNTMDITLLKGGLDGSTTQYEFSFCGNCYRNKSGTDKFLSGTGSGYAIKQSLDSGDNAVKYYFSTNGASVAGGDISWMNGGTPSIKITGNANSGIGFEYAGVISYLDTANGLDINSGTFHVNNDGSFGLGSSAFTVDASGNTVIGGVLTVLGGSDPPYELFFNETRLSVLEKVRMNVPTSKKDGIVTFYNFETDRMEYFKPSDCTFYKQTYDMSLDDMVLKPLQTIKDGKLCYNNNTYNVYFWDSQKGKIESYERVNYTSIKIPEGKEINSTSGKLINKTQVSK